MARAAAVVRQSVSYFTVPPRAHPAAALRPAPPARAAPGRTNKVPSTLAPYSKSVLSKCSSI